MARPVPILRDGILTDQHHGETRTIAVGTSAWERWLRDATAFVVEQEGATFTARKERAGNRRGGWYWRAYRTRNGLRQRAYLGKAEDLTPARLREAAALLAERGHPDPDHVDPAASERRYARRQRPAPSVGHSAASGGRARDVSSSRRYHPALLATKLSAPPVRPSAVARYRLHDQLRQVTRHKLVLVSAPAGSGKTTVLSAWAATFLGRRAPTSAPVPAPVPAPTPVAWLSLDDGDNDPTSFWTYCVAALDTLQPGIGDAARPLLSSAQAGSIPIVLTVLLNALAALPADVVLVLDDYHLIETPAIHEAMTFLIDHLPPRLHLLIATRADPTLPLARWRARGDLLELRAADLRFTEGETAAFLGQTMGLTLPEGDIAALAARTEGWIAGLQLAALSLQGQGHEESAAFIAAFAGDDRHILDYLAAEVLARQPDRVRAFLLRTCILDRLTGPLCDALTGQSDSQEVLATLERGNLFIAPLDHQRTWYRYHHLFAAALRALARRALPAQLPDLHRWASDWYEGHGLTREAIDHAMAAADTERAAALIEGFADASIWSYGEVETLRRWLAPLPEPVVSARPRLCILHAWTLQYFLGHGAVDRDTAAATLDRADARLCDAQRQLAPDDESSTTRTLRGEIAALRSLLSFSTGEIARIKGPACLALDLLPRENTTLRLLAARMLYNLYELYGDTTMVDRAMRELTAIGEMAHDVLGALNALFTVAQFQAMRGDLRRAAAAHRRALRRAEQELKTVVLTSPHSVGLGGILLEWDDLAGAEYHLTRGIASLEERGDPGVLVGAYRSLASLRQAQGDDAGALAALAGEERVVRRSQISPLAVGSTAAYRAWLTLARGDLPTARQWADARTRTQTDEDLSTLTRRMELTIAARIYLATGEVEATLRLLARLLVAAEDTRRLDRTIELWALQALALAARGDEAGAIEALTRALALAEPGGYIRTFTREGAPMARLLARVRASWSPRRREGTRRPRYPTRSPLPTSAPSWRRSAGPFPPWDSPRARRR